MSWPHDIIQSYQGNLSHLSINKYPHLVVSKCFKHTDCSFAAWDDDMMVDAKPPRFQQRPEGLRWALAPGPSAPETFRQCLRGERSPLAETISHEEMGVSIRGTPWYPQMDGL